MSAVTWTPERFLETIRVAANGAAKAGAEVAADHARRSMGGGAAEKRFGHTRDSYTSSPVGGYPGVRSGHLRRSITAVGTEVTGRDGLAAYGTNVRYGRTHEFGAVIRPKRGKLLAIPLSGLAQSLLIRAGGNVRNIPGLRLIRGKKNLLLVLDVGGRKARTELLFALVPSVTVPARPWAMRSARESAPRMVEAMKAEFRLKLARSGAVVS